MEQVKDGDALAQILRRVRKGEENALEIIRTEGSEPSC